MKRDGGARRRLVLGAVCGATFMAAGGAGTAFGATPLATQDPASAQPTLPKPMPGLTIPMNPSDASGGKKTKHVAHRRIRRGSASYDRGETIERPALATVDLTERLPYPPQPPHVTVSVPAYPFENFVVAFTTPPPPIVCRPTRRDRYQPDPHLLGEQAVLCTADNP